MLLYWKYTTQKQGKKYIQTRTCWLISWKAWTWLGGCRTRVRCGCPRVGAASEFFFFLEFAPTWLNSHRFGFDSHRTGLIRLELGRIGWWPKWPKSTLNHAGIAEIGFEWGPNIQNLSFLNFIMNICYFFVFSFLFCVSCHLLSLFCESRP